MWTTGGRCGCLLDRRVPECAEARILLVNEVADSKDLLCNIGVERLVTREEATEDRASLPLGVGAIENCAARARRDSVPRQCHRYPFLGWLTAPFAKGNDHI